MAQMTGADFQTGLNITGTPTLGTNTVSYFWDTAISEVYLKSDLKVAAATNSREFDWQPYEIVGYTFKIKDFSGATKFADADGNEATTPDTPVVPDPSGDGNRLTPYFFNVRPIGGSQIKYEVHESELLPKADAKTYFANQVANL